MLVPLPIPGELLLAIGAAVVAPSVAGVGALVAVPIVPDLSVKVAVKAAESLVRRALPPVLAGFVGQVHVIFERLVVDRAQLALGTLERE